ncbi:MULTISPECIES: hypothetical protein [Halomonadaceae]|uniref:Uncharacterized protein n=1 Tax=Vreelandella titanicae TaxID=664683 RepID=A0AAP9T2Q9_9GAMM|nr:MULTISPECIES: hypothetical protein [Halomonas]QKS25701.1 hypothetical protein FX987_03497 [Halomonas titanicae]SDI67655.1 hypothetical protein SAMN04487867_11141 [Halomonas titanicae]|tara:strand:+ start:673 stop:1584 length:912 start_codon:yes stop_codon:yes gene_type:complete
MKSLIALILSLSLSMGAQAMAQEIEYQYGVRWSVNGLASSVDIQDIMLDFQGVPSEQNRMLPITQYVRNGRNALQFYAWPVPSAEPFEEQHELRLSIEYWEPGENPNIDAKTAFEVVMMPGVEDAKPEVVSINSAAPVQPRESGISWDQDYFKLTVPFNNRQPMPTWCWEEGDVLRDNEATRNSLAREYRRLHALFAAGDNEALLNAAATRTKELALASGTPEEYVRHRFSYDMFFDNPDVYQLNDFPEEPMTLNLAADNRVAWLTTEGVQVPIRFNHIQENDVSSRVRPYFIRRDGQWEICR